MADLPSTFAKVNDVEVTQDAPVTEALEAKMGSNDNYLKDNLDAEIVTRAAGDAANAAAIAATNAAAATLTGRVNNAKNITLIYDGALDVYTDPYPSDIVSGDRFSMGGYYLKRSGGTWQIFKLVLGVSFTSIFDTGVPENANNWAELDFDYVPGSNNAFVYARVWQHSAV